VSRAPRYFIGIFHSDFSFGRRAGVIGDAFSVPEGCAQQAVQVVCLQPKIDRLKMATRRNKAVRQECRPTCGHILPGTRLVGGPDLIYVSLRR